MTWPTKDDFVDGDVLTAAQVNNIADNLNLFDPTSATSGQVPVANGAGSVAWGSSASMSTITSGTLPTGAGTITFSTIPQTFKQLMLYFNDFRVATNGAFLQIRINGSTNAYRQAALINSAAGIATTGTNSNAITVNRDLRSGFDQQMWLCINQYTQVAYHGVMNQVAGYDNTANSFIELDVSTTTFTPAAVDSITVFLSTGNYAAGTYALYGVN